MDNYVWMRNQMRRVFLKYDQKNMIEKCKLNYDADYLYLMFLNRTYRIQRTTGVVERCNERVQADYNETMVIYDLLCYSKSFACLTGNYVSIYNLKNTVQSATPGHNMFAQFSDVFNQKVDSLCSACEILGGQKEGIGDVCYRLPLMTFVSVIFQFWVADDEFPPQIIFLWDEKILEVMHYETLFFAMHHILKRLLDIIQSIERKENSK